MERQNIERLIRRAGHHGSGIIYSKDRAHVLQMAHDLVLHLLSAPDWSVLSSLTQPQGLCLLCYRSHSATPDRL